MFLLLFCFNEKQICEGRSKTYMFYVSEIEIPLVFRGTALLMSFTCSLFSLPAFFPFLRMMSYLNIITRNASIIYTTLESEIMESL